MVDARSASGPADSGGDTAEYGRALVALLDAFGGTRGAPQVVYRPAEGIATCWVCDHVTVWREVNLAGHEGRGLHPRCRDLLLGQRG